MTRKYPLFFLFLSFLAGAIYFYHFPINVLYVFFTVVFVVSFLLFALLLEWFKLSSALVCVLFFLIACVWVTFFIPPKMSSYVNRYVILYGRVDRVVGKGRAEFLPYWIRYKGRSDDVKLRTILFFPKSTLLNRGDYLLLRGKFRLLEEPETDYQFNRRYSYWSKGIYFSIGVFSDRNLLVTGKDRRSGVLSALRRKISSFVRGVMEEDTSALLLSLTTGDRHFLPKDVRELFYKLGLGHLLAISGLHVGVIVSFILVFVSLFLLPLWYRLAIASVFLVLYLLFVGMVPSVFRAVVMGVVLLLSWLTGNRYSSVNVLGLAGLIFLFVNPFAWMGVGFVLSFVVTFFLIYAVPLFDSRGGLFASLKVLFVAQFSSLPFVLYFFNFYNLISIPANLLVVPMVSVVIPLGLLGELLGLINTVVGGFLLFVADVVLRFMLDVMRFLAGVSGFSLRVPVFSIWIVLILYTGLFFLFLKGPWKRMYVITISVMLLLLGFFLLWNECGYVRVVHLARGSYFTVAVGLPHVNDAFVVSNSRSFGKYLVMRLGKGSVKKVNGLEVEGGRISVKVLPTGEVFIGGKKMPTKGCWAVELEGG